MLIRSCVFHYEPEMIRPLPMAMGTAGVYGTRCYSSSGTLLLLGSFPVESMIHARQPKYYAAINTFNTSGRSTAFIEFMLLTIKASLIDAINISSEISDGSMDKATMRWKKIEKLLETHEFFMNTDVQSLCGVSAATANRYLTWW